jgi:hypothetical protein
MKTLEARTGVVIPEGYDPEISILRLTLDPVNVSEPAASATGYLS